MSDDTKPRGTAVPSTTVYVDERGLEMLQEEGRLTIPTESGERIHLMVAEFEETNDQLEPEARIGLE